nr:probable helicase CHR10 isoform X1 [Ipomoea batatas]
MLRRTKNQLIESGTLVLLSLTEITVYAPSSSLLTSHRFTVSPPSKLLPSSAATAKEVLGGLAYISQQQVTETISFDGAASSHRATAVANQQGEGDENDDDKKHKVKSTNDRDSEGWIGGCCKTTQVSRVSSLY